MAKYRITERVDYFNTYEYEAPEGLNEEQLLELWYDEEDTDKFMTDEELWDIHLMDVKEIKK